MRKLIENYLHDNLGLELKDNWQVFPIKSTKAYVFVLLVYIFLFKSTKSGHFVLLKAKITVKRTQLGHFVLLSHIR